ncbi:MAG: hypothetical protein HRU18_02625 [Pseudoalteromonas sp.]|uniref:hypothetical protein n=1 Tax=Pseudoalteromonas sp. TaxID=53249 RepID=UPI001DA97EAD|nr:hypothetical protein [Pseudoalteromonas sp.]NRA77078.1 hypothetical protein [Pseudoalteromonas sp.]
MNHDEFMAHITLLGFKQTAKAPNAIFYQYKSICISLWVAHKGEICIIYGNAYKGRDKHTPLSMEQMLKLIDEEVLP